MNKEQLLQAAREFAIQQQGEILDSEKDFDIENFLVGFGIHLGHAAPVEPLPNVFHFGPYTLRPATEADGQLAQKWVELDSFHHGKVDPRFFIEEEPGVGTYLLESGEEELFFLRTENVTRVHIQFGQAKAEQIRDALTDGFNWLAAVLAQRGITELLFQSSSPLLIRFAEKRMGFKKSPDELSRGLGAERAYIAREKGRRDEPHTAKDEG